MPLISLQETSNKAPKKLPPRSSRSSNVPPATCHVHATHHVPCATCHVVCVALAKLKLPNRSLILSRQQSPLSASGPWTPPKSDLPKLSSGSFQTYTKPTLDDITVNLASPATPIILCMEHFKHKYDTTKYTTTATTSNSLNQHIRT